MSEFLLLFYEIDAVVFGAVLLSVLVVLVVGVRARVRYLLSQRAGRRLSARDDELEFSRYGIAGSGTLEDRLHRAEARSVPDDE